MKPQGVRRQSKGNKRFSQAAMKKLFAEVKEKSERPYSAFKASEESRPSAWLCVYLSNDNGRELSVSYSSLMSINSDNRWNTIVLKFSPPFSIVISGHSLEPLYKKLLRHEVESITKFDPKIWKAPRPGEPCILGVEMCHALN